MKRNPSQYSGTLKDSLCTLCGEDLNSKDADEQEQHARKCIKLKKEQQTLD